MKHYETKEVTEKKKVLKFVSCDSCEKEIDTEEVYFNLIVVESIGRWYWKDTDMEEKQYCSEKCILADLVESKELLRAITEDDFESLEIEKVNKED